MAARRPYACRIVISRADGSSAQQDHVRHTDVSIERFTSESLGRMLRMLSEWQDDRGLSVTGWTITEIPVSEVR